MKLIRKLYLSIITLVMVAICLSTTTYAWFEQLNRTSVKNFNFTAQSADGILTSVDGVHFSKNLTAEQIYSAILLSHNVEGYEFNEDGKLIVKQSDEITEELLVDNLANRVKTAVRLMPCTTLDGRQFKDLANSNVTVRSGRYLEFSVYFRTASEEAEADKSFDIKLLTTDYKAAGEDKVSKTTIKAAAKTEVNLEASMTTLDGIKQKGDKIDVYTHNAMRMSITNDTSGSTQIYEMPDDHDLGSYATSYDGDDESLLKYKYSVSASYTYYSNLKNSASALEATRLDYENENTQTFLNSIINLNTATAEELPTIVNVKSGESPKKVTLRFWLEGWDADCFDGLSQGLKVNLSFKAYAVGA